MVLPVQLQYDSPFPLYGLSFSNSDAHRLRIATTSYMAGPTNKIQVFDIDFNSSSPYSASNNFTPLAQANLQFPATKVAWQPSDRGLGNDEERELLATTGDVLRIWEIDRDYEDEYGGNGWGGGTTGYSLTPRSVLTNSKSPATNLPPITSLSWNTISPGNIVTCSIDTTATLWDINTSQALTQLIAHDRAVYDLSWLPQSADIFVSVGADGSLRAFDLRTLEHSTILYESPNEAPLARIAFSNKEQHMLACFGVDDSKVLILDMRSPGQPVAELIGHSGALSGIAWGAGGPNSPSGGGWIASCGDDCQLLLWDLTSPIPERPKPTPKNPNGNGQPNGVRSPSASPLPNAYGLSPVPSQELGTGSKSPSPGAALDLSPVRAWNADMEINNLAFDREGEWVGCVSGQRLNVLKV
ncbi:hypothetical protein M231_05273 [Tremella mesenterica]|uniref:Uncharacterized protein n=1 Tax=Tremella mesenterica TaxID=5217 RepID=A0A4Q1BIJ6_TREME|nr:hypothetical protein M231_05273 [Tremella mesenterica]